MPRLWQLKIKIRTLWVAVDREVYGIVRPHEIVLCAEELNDEGLGLIRIYRLTQSQPLQPCLHDKGGAAP
jgi:hypothetical protein